MLFLQKNLGNRHVILLKYEDLKKNTTQEINKIAKWKPKNEVIEQINYDAKKLNINNTYKKNIYEEIPKNVHNFIQKKKSTGM